MLDQLSKVQATINTTKELQDAYVSLQNDLKNCWEDKFWRIDAGLLEWTLENAKNEENSFFYCIDPESMVTLNLIYGQVGTKNMMAAVRGIMQNDLITFLKTY